MADAGRRPGHARRGGRDGPAQVVHPVQTVYLNAVDLRVTSASLARAGVAATTPPVAIYHEVASKPILALDFAGPLERGPATLHLAFSGILNDKLAGFYRSKYTVDGEVRYLATTQFEATDARRAFPCWDEPALKATFDVTLVVPHDRVAISNMPIVESADLPETHQRVVRFGRSPVMSTYLLAFIVGEFDSLSAQTETDVEVRVYTPVGKADLGNFALRVATRALVYYSELFGIPYPLPKMDLIAIPDFAAGAMEVWMGRAPRERVVAHAHTNAQATDSVGSRRGAGGERAARTGAASRTASLPS